MRPSEKTMKKHNFHLTEWGGGQRTQGKWARENRGGREVERGPESASELEKGPKSKSEVGKE